jgi:aminoglycoside 2''-phosphotransferase
MNSQLMRSGSASLLLHVAIKSISLNCEGLVNDVVIVNRELIFRFPKVEHGFKHLKNEARILRFLTNYITLEIPSLLYESSDVLGYRMIPEEALRRDLVLRLSEDDQQAVADQLAQFLKELHGVPIDELASFEMPIDDASGVEPIRSIARPIERYRTPSGSEGMVPHKLSL